MRRFMFWGWKMLTIKFVNDGIGAVNYVYYVFINRKEIARGVIENHDRKDGWEKLVIRLAENLGEDIKYGTM